MLKRAVFDKTMCVLVLILLLAVSSCSDDSSSGSSSPDDSSSDSSSPTDNRWSDLIILIDESASVTPTNFPVEKEYVVDLITNYIPDKFRIGVYSFSNVVTLEFPLTEVDSSNEQSLIDTINALVYDNGNGTDTLGALNAAINDLDHTDDIKSKKIILITDGPPWLGGSSQDISGAKPELDNLNITTIVIGITNNVNVSSFTSILNNPSEEYIVVSDFTFNALTAHNNDVYNLLIK